ncbi:MAG: hypothetical protein K8R48_05650 [Alphaproteobacteria bacterium]|nr:hypothetical protein [Alphaproteobacteria bacterium]
MPFDYSKSGLPANPKWEKSLNMCYGWLTRNMSMFGPERIESFMLHQPIAAAKLLIANCSDCSEELITLTLMGPSKGNVLADQNAMDVSRNLFGERTVELMKYLSGMSAVKFDNGMPADATRLFLVEGLSTMNDQLIGRAKIDKHHQVRWNILKGLEQSFATVKGQNPGLDKIFGEALVKSRAALEALDNPAKKGPKPPQP